MTDAIAIAAAVVLGLLLFMAGVKAYEYEEPPGERSHTNGWPLRRSRSSMQPRRPRAEVLRCSSSRRIWFAPCAVNSTANHSRMEPGCRPT